MACVVRNVHKQGKQPNSPRAVKTTKAPIVFGNGKRDPTTGCPEIKSLSRNDVAFSTGQAARYCFVTGDTVLNWINAGSLSAQKTAGGQYRIRASELYRFLREHEMSTDLLEAELSVRPMCWEFNCQRQTELGCAGCLVSRSGAPRCYELREVLHDAAARPVDCQECDYYQRYCRRKGTPA